MESHVVISVGGSLIVPDGIDTEWIGRFGHIIHRYVDRGYRFALVAGGGRTARRYQEAAKRFCYENDEIDIFGIYATRMNARLLGKALEAEVIENPVEAYENDSKIVVTGGWKPGFSTDYVAVLLAKRFGNKVINLTDQDYVYDKDPKEHMDAKPIREISWRDFRNLVGEEWNPGMHLPFDPVASMEAEKSGTLVVIINGKDLTNFENYLYGRKLKGTLIGLDYE